MGTQPEQPIVQTHGRLNVHLPQIAVLDVRLEDSNGIDVCREIRSEFDDVQCLILTSFNDDEALFQAIMAGASGYILKEVKGTGLVDAIREVGPQRARELGELVFALPVLLNYRASLAEGIIGDPDFDSQPSSTRTRSNR